MSNNEVNTGLEYTQRQMQTSFQPPINVQFQQTQIVPPLPLNTDVPSVPTAHPPLPLEQEEAVSSTTLEQQPIRPDAPSFTPSPGSNATKPENSSQSSFIYDLKKYKFDYFISNPTCDFDRGGPGKFGSPTGICTLNDDRLLVANFDRDTILLLDIQGTIHQIYRDLPSPKDVLYYSSNPSQAVVATRKEAIILDLETKQVVVRSKSRGFFPWNIQYIKEHDTFAACDPSAERIVFLDKNLVEVGGWSFNDQAPGQIQGYQKVYPYAAYFFPDNTSLALTHRENKCQLAMYDTAAGQVKMIYTTPPALQSYSIYADGERKCLIADKVNRRLLSIKQDSSIEEYKWKSIQEPYSMTFLSTGTLCVTDWNKSFGTNGGVAVISEVDLKVNQ